MNILIIGKGQVGTILVEALKDHSVTLWQHNLIDLTRDELAKLSPDVVINAAGKTELLWCETHAREAFHSNVEAPIAAYRAVRSLNDKTFFIHFSSGCIWDGPYRSDGKPFEPYDPPIPAAFYSWTKAACDAMLLDEDPNRVAILRPRQVFSPIESPRNTLMKLVRYEKLIDTPNSMTSAETIVKMVRYLLNATSDRAGIWNVYDKGVTSPFHVGELLAEAKLRPMPTAFTKAELDSFHKPKRVDTVLYDERFERLIQPEPLEDMLKKAIAALAT